MGALKAERASQRETELWSHDATRIETLTTLVYPSSPYSSASSSCEKISPPRSTRRLRRSTVDLSQIRSSPDFFPFPSQQRQEIDTAGENKEGSPTVATGSHFEELVEDAVFHYLPIIQTIILVETGIRKLFNETHHHVGNVFGFLLNSLFARNSRVVDVITDDAALQGLGKDFEEPPADPPLSPAKVTNTPNSNSKDEWGHFADFQEELAEDKFFIPSCFPKTSSLETLEEDIGNEGDGEALSF